MHLEGLCLLNHSEVHVARQRYEEARSNAEQALAIFDRLGARLDKADAYKVLGVVYRETGRFTLAESRLQAAIEQAVATGSVLSEAEASRELARLYQGMGRNQEALQLLNAAHRLFSRLDARVDLVDVTSKTNRLEETYFAVVRDWGQSIESADSYTFGHCERVASYGVAVAEALGADQGQLTTIRMGAYLHDLGKVKVPHQILNKPGKLTDDEFDVIKRHPVWGVELLASVEFPWNIKPIIRSHHERYDGTGYPDRLKGDEIPLGAQIICIVDVYDALTTTRSYRGAMEHATALARMEESRHWWRPDVYAAFLRSVGSHAAGRLIRAPALPFNRCCTAILADLVVGVHALFVAFVVLGGLLALRWPWVAVLHLPAAVWGALIEFQGWICPLTPLEKSLRARQARRDTRAASSSTTCCRCSIRRGSPAGCSSCSGRR